MISQNHFCANPACPYHNVIDEEIIKHGIMESRDDRGTMLIERKQLIVIIDGEEKQLWFCSICATRISATD